MSNQKNPIQINSIWEDAAGNEWKVIEKLPGGKVTLFDFKRIIFSDTYQSHIRTRIEEGRFTLKTEA